MLEISLKRILKKGLDMDYKHNLLDGSSLNNKKKDYFPTDFLFIRFLLQFPII